MAEAERLQAAWVYAERSGLPLNTMVTIHLGLAPSAERADPVVRFGLIREAMGAWLTRRGVTFAWVAVRENPRDKGEHAHIALYVPQEHALAFSAQVPAWVALGADCVEERAFKIDPVWAWVGLRNYFLKGGTEEVRRAYQIPRKLWLSQGWIEGPRVSIAHSLGPTARRATGKAAEGLQAAA